MDECSDRPALPTRVPRLQLSGLSSLAGNRIGDAASIGAMNPAVAIDATAQALWITAALTGTRVIGRSTERQQLRAGGLRAAGLLQA